MNAVTVRVQKEEDRAGKTNGAPMWLTVTVAAEDAAKFPKSAGLTNRFNGPVASTTINLQATKGNTRNDAGLKRYATVLRAAAKAGLPIEHTVPAAERFMTADEFAAYLAS